MNVGTKCGLKLLNVFHNGAIYARLLKPAVEHVADFVVPLNVVIFKAVYTVHFLAGVFLSTDKVRYLNKSTITGLVLRRVSMLKM